MVFVDTLLAISLLFIAILGSWILLLATLVAQELMTPQLKLAFSEFDKTLRKACSSELLDCKSIQNLSKFWSNLYLYFTRTIWHHRILHGVARGKQLKLPLYLTPKPEVVGTQNLACCSSRFFEKTGFKMMTLT